MDKNFFTNITILDVRSHQEFCSGHLCYALNVSMKLPPWTKVQEEDFKNKLWKIWHANPERTYVVYCKTGKRSKLATDTLRQFGANVINLGGIKNGLLTPLFQNKVKRPGYKLCYCNNNSF